jgi:diguanylate cyclase (GGDEF)-like protein/PAS domain S-box-containing protein
MPLGVSIEITELQFRHATVGMNYAYFLYQIIRFNNKYMPALATTSADSPHERRFFARLAARLGLNSFRGRFVYGVALSSGLMIATTWLADKDVSLSTKQGISHATDQQETNQALRGIASDIWETQIKLRSAPGSKVFPEVLEQLNRAMAQAAPLSDLHYVTRSAAAQKASRDLVTSLELVREKVIQTQKNKRLLAELHNNTLADFARVQDSLQILEKNIDGHTTEDMRALAQAVDRQLQTLWLATTAVICVLIAGLFLFALSIRRPLIRVTGALRAEAEGAKQVAVPHTMTQETENLAAAFDYMHRKIHARQQRLETILDNAAEGIITFDTEGRIDSFNQAAEKLFGYTEDEVIGKDLRLIIPPQTRESRADYLSHIARTEIQRLIGHEGEVIGRHQDSSTFPIALKISSMTLEGKQFYTGLVADISERKAMVENLKNMAEHDGLTGLYNRSYFQQELDRVVERVKRTGGMCCSLLYIDLDNFKYVNDTLGHSAGDRLIVEVAAILNKRARKSDLIARFGGDEFTVLLFDTTPMLSVQAAESFRTKLADYIFKHSGQQIDIGCSIGVTGITPTTASAVDVLSQADLACHLAKRGGRNRVHLFNPDDAESVTAMTLDMGWSRRIKDAIENDSFVLACQPIVNTATREVDSYKVLIRMLDERNELIMPAGFLSTAERFGLSADIDKWVIQRAIGDLARQRGARPDLRYSINLSGRTLTTPGICEVIQEQLKATGLDPTALTFEVTETAAIADMSAAENFLARLQSMGCLTALDDFGSGMASFAYLKDLPVNSVKIDGRFVKNLAVNLVDQAMVKAMNEISHALGKQTVAEFVENEESFKMLAAFGVDFGQGYYLGRPDVTLPCATLSKGRCPG